MRAGLERAAKPPRGGGGRGGACDRSPRTRSHALPRPRARPRRGLEKLEVAQGRAVQLQAAGRRKVGELDSKRIKHARPEIAKHGEMLCEGGEGGGRGGRKLRTPLSRGGRAKVRRRNALDAHSARRRRRRVSLAEARRGRDPLGVRAEHRGRREQKLHRAQVPETRLERRARAVFGVEVVVDDPPAGHVQRDHADAACRAEEASEVGRGGGGGRRGG